MGENCRSRLTARLYAALPSAAKRFEVVMDALSRSVMDPVPKQKPPKAPAKPEADTISMMKHLTQAAPLDSTRLFGR